MNDFGHKKPMRYRLIVFDWDGTLMDSAALIVRCIQAAARDIGVEPPVDARARHVIGLGLVEALQQALPDLPASRYASLVERYRHHYLSKDHEVALFSGAAGLIAELAARQHWLAVATGKSRKGLDRALSNSGLGAYFHASRCADECHSKPHPQMLEELMTELAVSPAQTLMIGDTTHDLLMAQNAGVDAVGVAYGAHGSTDLRAASPCYLAASMDELRIWLSRNI